jgi:hypothetical protein
MILCWCETVGIYRCASNVAAVVDIVWCYQGDKARQDGIIGSLVSIDRSFVGHSVVQSIGGMSAITSAVASMIRFLVAMIFFDPKSSRTISSRLLLSCTQIPVVVWSHK